MPMMNLQFDFQCDFCDKLYQYKTEGFIKNIDETIIDMVSSLVNEGWEIRIVKGEKAEKHICPNCIEKEKGNKIRENIK